MPTEWTIGDGPTDSVPAGTLIGAYRVEAPLGEGGMGTVYRATDTKLNRPVAIKLLSDEFADVAARHRFQREAQLASSLNHPHILTVYDVGEYQGRQYLVTEFVDGGPAASRFPSRDRSGPSRPDATYCAEAGRPARGPAKPSRLPVPARVAGRQKASGE